MSQAALEQLAGTLSGHREVLLAKKRQLERAEYRAPPLGMVQATGGSVASQTSGQGDDGQEKR